MDSIVDNTMTSLQEVVNAYNKLEITTKRKELGIELSELIIVVKQLLNDVSEQGALFDVSSLDDYENLYNGLISEGEYLTGMYEDILILKELLGIYLSKVNSLIYKN